MVKPYDEKDKGLRKIYNTYNALTKSDICLCIGDRIKRLRIEKGFNLHDLGKKFSQTTWRLNNIENDKQSHATLEEIVELLLLLNVNFEDLFYNLTNEELLQVFKKRHDVRFNKYKQKTSTGRYI